MVVLEEERDVVSVRLLRYLVLGLHHDMRSYEGKGVLAYEGNMIPALSLHWCSTTFKNTILLLNTRLAEMENFPLQTMRRAVDDQVIVLGVRCSFEEGALKNKISCCCFVSYLMDLSPYTDDRKSEN